ncbi:MAG: GntR family transcriptional regulator [Desulfotignum sp.]
MIEQKSSRPKYAQIYHWFQEQFQVGTFVIGDQIPTETALAEKFQVTRMTVRKALNRLVMEGLIIRTRGKGSFVSAQNNKNHIFSLNTISGFFSDIRRSGSQPASKVNKVETIQADAKIAAPLQLSRDLRVIYVLRTFFADQEPALIQGTYLPYEPFKRVLDMDLSKGMYPIYRDKFNLRLHHADQTFTAVMSNKFETELFGFDSPQPCIFLEWVLYDDINRPIEVCYCTYRSDKYKFNVISSLPVQLSMTP